MTVDLARLKAALDEDERVALACRGESWELQNEAVYGATSADVIAEVGMRRTNTSAEVGEHIARHDPARVLRWIRAAREILDRHPKIEISGGRVTCDGCYDAGHIGYPCPDVRSLMSVYGDTDE